MPNSIRPHLSTPVFSNQQKAKPPAPKTREVGQDKGHFENAPSVAAHAAPFVKEGGARALNTKTVQRQKTTSGRAKLIHSTFHAEPRVHAEMQRLAGEQGLSFSETVNAACRFYATATIEQQHAGTLRDVLRQTIREELHAFGHRIVYFLLRIAFAAEQGKLLITNVLKFVLKLSGLDHRTYVTLVDESAKRARRNILANTPQFKALLVEWEESEGKEDTGK
jgi:hypothetical protein